MSAKLEDTFAKAIGFGWGVIESGTAEIADRGFTFLPASIFSGVELDQDFDGFATFWEMLPADPALPGGAMYRERRFGRMRVTTQNGNVGFERMPAGTFRQDSIQMWAGQERVFAEIAEEQLSHPALRALVGLDATLAQQVTGIDSWDVGIHFIRIVATHASDGLATPEGRHSDGHALVGMHLIRREDIGGAESTVWAEDGSQNCLTMTAPLDSMMVDDRRVTHGVSPCHAVGERGVRDMLLVDLNPAGEG